MLIGNYEFSYIETISPVISEDKKIYRYAPQTRYNNKKKLPLHEFGEGKFCKFCLQKAEAVSGVYAWIVSGQTIPIYIGEAKNLKKRFNMGYGIISPRNCFVGGQATNCKMNKAVLDCYSKGYKIEIYFFRTNNHKEVELELLQSIKTKYNTKNN